MKRMLPFLLALLLLSACGQIAPEPETETETTVIITEPETTTTSDESAEITWRTIDIASADGREIKEWLAEQYEECMADSPTEFSMGKDKTIAYRGEYYRDIVLRDNKTGKETVLLEHAYYGEETTPEAALNDEVFWKSPRFVQALDECYFVYYWGYWEGRGEIGVFDTKNMREFPIEWDEKYRNEGYDFNGPQFCGDGLYLTDDEYGPYSGVLHLMRVDLKALDKLPLMAVDMLKGIAGEDVEEVASRIVTQDERYFILTDNNGLRIYDLQKKKLALGLDQSIFGPGRANVAVLRGDKIYWTDDNSGIGKYLAEITLP